MQTVSAAEQSTQPPDDWTLAQQVRHDTDFVEATEWHYARVLPLIKATLAGHIACCPALLDKSIQPMTASDLYETITEDVDQAEMAKLLISPLDWEAKASSWVFFSELIEGYAKRTAEFLATAEMRVAA